ncbi:MAG: hypothetical protein AAED33_14920 [Paracoccaceae bacterium]
MQKLFLAAVAVIASVNSAQSGSKFYICEINDFLFAKTMSEGNTDYNNSLMIRTKGSTLTIDRLTGRVIHEAVGNSFYRNTIILNEGSKEWGFKVFSDSGTGGSSQGGRIAYYDVKEYFPGDEKPFIALVDGVAITGICN